MRPALTLGSGIVPLLDWLHSQVTSDLSVRLTNLHLKGLERAAARCNGETALAVPLESYTHCRDTCRRKQCIGRDHLRKTDMIDLSSYGSI